MQVPLEWIKEYIDLQESPEDIAGRFTMAGLEVSEVARERFGLGESFVGRVVRSEPHPERPGFHVLTVEGGGHSATVLTNLRAFQAGELLPIARPGFIFPDGTALEPRKIAGVTSDGKILSEADLSLSSNAESMASLPETAKPGDIVPDVFGLTDLVLKFDLTANRGDCLSVFGICRELSAILDRPLKKSPFDFTLETAERDVEFSVAIKDKNLCPRYSGRLLRDIRIAQSPDWLKRRLTACGMRPINSIVDVTNYVMLETGQPLHAFDLDTLEDRAIVVRRAKNGEKITTLDGAERELDNGVLVIADSRKPVAVAGVMGGADTEITGGTKNMLLESAHFDPRAVRRGSVKLGLRTEACMRFEKGVDPERVTYASDYASTLISKLGWGVPQSGMIDANPKPYKQRAINVPFAKIRSFIGEESLDNERIVNILRNLDFVVLPGKSSMKVDVPSHRFDVSIWEDLAEEVTRIFGYNNVRSTLPTAPLHRSVMQENFAFVRKLKDMLAACGLSECVSFSFTNMRELEQARMGGAAAVEMQNPLTADHTHLRPSLLPVMLKTAAMNIRRGSRDISLFELGKIFAVSDGQQDAPRETNSICIALAGGVWRTPAKSELTIDVPLYYQLKGVIEDFLSRVRAPEPTFGPATHPLFHPGRSASVFVDGVKIGEAGEAHPAALSELGLRGGLALAELDPEPLRKYASAKPCYNKISRQPALSRDLSIIVSEETPAASISGIMREHGGGLLHSVSTVDVFRGGAIGAGKKSVTFTLEFRHAERTLGDAEVNERISLMLEGIRAALGGALREG